MPSHHSRQSDGQGQIKKPSIKAGHKITGDKIKQNDKDKTTKNYRLNYIKWTNGKNSFAQKLRIKKGLQIKQKGNTSVFQTQTSSCLNLNRKKN